MLKVLLIGNYENDRQESMQRFARMLLVELEKLGVAVELIRPRSFFGSLKRGATGLGKWLGYFDKFLVFPFALKRKLARARDGAVVHVCDHSNAFYIRYLEQVPHLVTCNDLLAVRSARGEFPRNPTSWTGRQLQRLILNGLRRARRITCISEATRGDLLRLTGCDPGAVDVTPMGLNPAYTPMPRVQALERLAPLIGGSSSFLLHVGGNQWYKNRPGVLRIFAALDGAVRPGKLVMVGPPFDRAMNAFLAAHPQIAPHVISLTEVDDPTLRALYSVAELLLFPSWEEGFGWPIVEAQACGCRVVTTGKPPMAGAGGEAAFYLPEPAAADEDGWGASAAKAVERVLSQDDAERAEAVARGLKNAARFSAAEMAQRYVAIYRELLYKSQS